MCVCVLVSTIWYQSCWVGIVQIRSMGCIGWGYGKRLEGVGGDSLVILDLRWEMALRLNFGITSGAEIKPLRKLSQIYTILLVAKDAFVEDYLELSGESH
jgi:hypothetical protein